MATPKPEFRRSLVRRPSSKEKPGSEGKGTEAERAPTAATANDYSSLKGDKSVGLSTPLSSKVLATPASQKAELDKPIIRIGKSKDKLKATAPANMYLKRPSSKR